MTAADAQTVAVQCPSDAVRADFGPLRSAGVWLSARLSPTGRWQIALGPDHRNAVAPAFNRGCSWAHAGERDEAARHQPGWHRRAPPARVGRRPGHCGATGRFLAPSARGTGAVVIRAAGPARGARTGR